MHKHALFAVLCVAATAPARASDALPAAAVSEIQQIIQTELETQNVPGISIAASFGLETLWAQGFGKADLQHNVAVTADTVFRLASISKTLTATATMQLAEQGKLDLDAVVQVYCPAFPEKDWPITTRQLLGHLAGVRHYLSDAEVSNVRHYWSLVEALPYFSESPLLQEPGTKFSYTTFGYNLLGCIVEGAGGQSFMAYLNDHVIRPAGADAMRDDNVFVIVPNRAAGYHRNHDGTLRNADYTDTSYKIPGGGLISRPTDLVRFATALLSNRLVDSATLQQMFTEQLTTAGEATHYGLGFELMVNNGNAEVFHGGAQEGTSTVLYMIPQHKLAIAMMSNREAVKLRPLVRKIAAVILKHTAPEVARPRADIRDRELRLLD